MDGPPAQSLGVEPPDEEVTKSNKPRASQEKIINKKLLKRVLVSAITIVIGTLYIFYKETDLETDAENNTTIRISTKRDTTMTFTCFVFFDMLNALSCRSQKQSVFALDFWANKAFIFAVFGSVFGQLCVIYVPFLQNVFQTEALSIFDLFYLGGIASSILVVTEVWKSSQRKKEVRKNLLAKNYYGNDEEKGQLIV